MRLETSYSTKPNVHPQIAESAVVEAHVTGLPLSDVMAERARFYEGARVRTKPDKAEGWGPQYGYIRTRAGVHVWLVEVDARFRKGRKDDGLREVTDRQMEQVP